MEIEYSEIDAFLDFDYNEWFDSGEWLDDNDYIPEEWLDPIYGAGQNIFSPNSKNKQSVRINSICR